MGPRRVGVGSCSFAGLRMLRLKWLKVKWHWVHSYVCTYVCTYICIHTYIHMYVCMYDLGLVLHMYTCGVLEAQTFSYGFMWLCALVCNQVCMWQSQSQVIMGCFGLVCPYQLQTNKILNQLWLVCCTSVLKSIGFIKHERTTCNSTLYCLGSSWAGGNVIKTSLQTLLKRKATGEKGP